MNPNFPKNAIARRRFLQLSGLSGTGLLVSGCVPAKFTDLVGQKIEPLNQSIQSLMLSQKPVPEFPTSAIEPEKLLINSFNFTPAIDLNTFRLIINGEVNHPLQLSMGEVQQLPLTAMTIRHVCVEGWAAIVQWGGVRLQELAKLVQPKEGVRYVYFKSADGYYESWDLASALHPQTLMVYQKNGKPLPADNGAPLRLAAPIKLGYKQSKWVTQVTFVKDLMPRKGYWVDKGYEWFAGL
ncbi:MAG: molybdopterin-dependent oxidoreductase [Hydrococcus sp. Prado102]|jgi:DMSO/TMAO reductase YedYZ molybdopterin-dependent catalytic subunit|nr:molybdopterin-dependent oxidoreductase [Hydrococcus sp. Prado102]